MPLLGIAAREAPIIVLGRVASIQEGEPMLEVPDIGDTLHVSLYRNTLAVDRVIRGDAPNTKLVFYTFRLASRYGRNGSFDRPRIGERGFFFLKSERGVLRSINDIYESHLDYPRPDVPAGTPFDDGIPAHEMAALLLHHPGPSEDAAVLSQNLGSWTRTSIMLAGPAFTERLLGPLLSSEVPALRDEACLAAYALLFTKGTCLESVIQTDPALATRVRADRETRARLDAAIRLALDNGREPPLALYASIDQRDPAALPEFYRAMADNPDPLIAQGARKELDLLQTK
jgi:hypothetical protein